MIGGRYINFGSDIFEFLNGIKANNVFITETKWINLDKSQCNKNNLLLYQNAVNLNLINVYRSNISPSKGKNIFHFVFFENSQNEDLDVLDIIRKTSEVFLSENGLMLDNLTNISVVDFNSIWHPMTMEKQDSFKLVTVIF